MRTWREKTGSKTSIALRTRQTSHSPSSHWTLVNVSCGGLKAGRQSHRRPSGAGREATERLFGNTRSMFVMASIRGHAKGHLFAQGACGHQGNGQRLIFNECEYKNKTRTESRTTYIYSRRMTDGGSHTQTHWR